ncbi:hypothetical protein GPALN_007962 [Globodera pallida]|nr:hypothetical protein GPALN_007962 [Globodera pallida]
MGHFYNMIQFLSLLAFCIAFPYLQEINEPLESRQLQQPTVLPQNVVPKEQFDGDNDNKQHHQKGEVKFIPATAEERLTEKETKYDHSDEEVPELRFPLDAVITQIEEDTNDFHDQLELRQQEKTSSESDANSVERVKLALRPSSAADESPISETKIPTDGEIPLNKGTPEPKAGTNVDEPPNESRANLNKTEMKGTESRTNETNENETIKVEVQADNVNEENGKDEILENETLEEIGGGKGGRDGQEQQQMEENVRTLPPLQKDGTTIRSLPPIIDVADIASAPDGRQFSEEQEEKMHENGKEETGELVDAKTVSLEDVGQEETLTWWDKIVLGLRCARNDCRETLVAGEERLPRVINGWKITRRARSTAAELKESVEFGTGRLQQFISMSTEIDFPRGGVSKILHIDSKKRRSGAKRVFSTDHSTPKKKHKIDDECAISYEGVFRQKLTRDLLTQNLRGLAFVKYIGEVDLTLEYVEGIIMKLPATQIGKIFTKNLASTEATLDELFTKGQALAFRVTVPPSTKARGKNSMPTVTVCPNEVNSHLIPSLLLVNSVLNGAISSIEEKGAVIDLGFSMSSANGFVHCDDLPPHLSLDKLRVGQVALFRVKEKPPTSARVIALSGFVEMGCLGSEGLPSALESKHLTPGAIVEVEPEKVVSDGIFVGINGGLKAFIRKVHLPPRLRFDPSKIAKKFRACCIGSQPNTSVLMLNAHPEILALSKCEKRLLPSEFKIGSRINGRVFHVDKQQNVFFKLDDDNEKHLLTAKALRIHIDNAEENLSRFSIGSVHECRVIGFSIVERQLFVTTRSVDLHQSIICAEEAKPGMRITGRIKSLNAKGMNVAFGRGFFGFVSMVHALDRPAKHWQKRFQTGQKLSCPEKQIVEISNDLAGVFSTGTVIKHLQGGSVLITFFGRIAGILPPSKVALLSSDAIAIGMPIKVRVKSVNVEQAKMLLDLPSEDNGFIGEFLQKTIPSGNNTKVVRSAKPFRVYTARVLGQWPYGGTSSATTAELLLPGGSIGRLHASELSFSRSELTEVICVSRSKSISGKGRELLLERHQSDRIVECTCIPDKVQESRKKLSLIRYREEFNTGNIVPVFIVDTAKKEEEDTDQPHIIGEINPDFRAIIPLDQKPSATTNTETEEAKPTNHLQLFDTGELRYGRVVSVNKTKKGRVVCLSLVNSKEFNDKEQSQSVFCQMKSKKKVKPTEEEKELEDGSIVEEPAVEEEQENEEDKEHDTTEKMGEDAIEPTTCFDLPEGPSLASVEEYEQFLIAHPNSCSGSIGFIRFCLTHEGLRMCRRYELGKDVAERALKMITFQNDSDLADVWRAYLNLEVALGTEESLQEVFKRACAASNAMQMHRYLIELLKKQTNAAGREEEIRELYESMVRRFRHHELEPWFEYGRHLLQQNDAEAFQRLLGRALHCSEKKKHLTILKRFAILEKSFGDKEKAKTIEELIKSVKEEKKKVDVRMLESVFGVRTED